ncbi:MAG: electron transfer flavoprotein subunit alpha/FixB family protein [Bryobacteraceae bacterium]|nr:electron transfer flavoprotein subunit alpha/FixB family protein [Bryobacteraceae bacterium]MDW8378362.1 electron transfer flavoprotein subunit alpha/FixB family protein [Bryobacterales bacterium]
MSQVLVITEQRDGVWHKMSWETLVAGQELAASLGLSCSAAVLGASSSSVAQQLANKKLEKVFVLDHPLLSEYTADAYAAAVEQLVRHTGPTLVLFPHTYQVRDFAPKVATRFSRLLITDVIKIRVEQQTPVFVRLLFQGKLNGEIRAAGAGPHFASVQAGAYRADALQEGSSILETFSPSLAPEQIRARPQAPFRETARAVDLSTAELIVSVGRGIKEKENLPLVEELAKALGAELAASRPICDNGWLPMERQVGSSGQTVAPKLYLAVGISGAIQHLVGMKAAKTIVAINKDANAPIFEVADIGVVGDLFEVVPALTEEVRKLKG